MEHIAALLLIVACSDTSCRELPPPVAVYETAEACRDQLQPTISAFTTRHPQVFGKCIDVDPALEDDYTGVAWSIAADGTLEASLELPDAHAGVTVAFSRDSREKDYLSQE